MVAAEPPTWVGGGGPSQCAIAEVCCNPSCGICAAPDDRCVTISCDDDAGQSSEAGSLSDGDGSHVDTNRSDAGLVAAPLGTAAAWRICGTAGRSGWRVELSDAVRATCEERPAGTLVIEVWEEIEGATPRTLSIGLASPSGAAAWCPTAHGACVGVVGTVVFDSFVAGETAQIDAEVLMPDRSRITFTSAMLDAGWCELDAPVCP